MESSQFCRYWPVISMAIWQKNCCLITSIICRPKGSNIYWKNILMSNPAKTVGNTSILLLALENTGRLWGYKIARVIPVIFAGHTLAVYCKKLTLLLYYCHITTKNVGWCWKDKTRNCCTLQAIKDRKRLLYFLRIFGMFWTPILLHAIGMLVSGLGEN